MIKTDAMFRHTPDMMSVPEAAKELRIEKWQSLDLAAKKGTKTEANHRLNQILERYNSGDLYLRETMTHAERERNRIADLKIEDYLTE
ncbi:MAG: hypothetical protein IKH78_09530 [Ruminococcus sp.]|nr:hypothetical protein [Ruminococcus sp.]MBR6968761.1 hypothetical protein [Ruminococcus sp.]